MSYIWNNDTLLQISSWEIDWTVSVHKFWENIEVWKNTEEDIWDWWWTYNYPTTADITHLSQISNKANDRWETVFIEWLDINYNIVQQQVNLNASNSTTKVALTTPLLRLYRMMYFSDHLAEDDIIVTNSWWWTEYWRMIEWNNQTMMCQYTVPLWKKAYITSLYASAIPSDWKKPKSVHLRLKIADRWNGFDFMTKWSMWIPEKWWMVLRDPKPYMQLTEKMDLKISAYCDWQKGYITAWFDIILVDD